MRTVRNFAPIIVAAVAFGGATPARAGGFDLPDNGAEAVGRGGAFAAKADSPLALYYNIAGMARQRGTRVLLDANLQIHDMTFTRAGTYPDTLTTAYAGKPYPAINDSERIFPVPFLGITTDFGYFERWTFGIGAYGPPSIGKHNFGVKDKATEIATVTMPDGSVVPAPSRYDVSRTDLLVIFPTLGAAVSATKWLDLGLALQLAYGHFDLANANVTKLGPNNCKAIEDANCDAYGNVRTSGLSWGMVVSALLHPTPYLDIGLSYRPQIDIHTEGTIKAYAPPALHQEIPDAPATFNTMQPHVLRLGVRYVSRYLDGTERYDVELDGTYERWSSLKDRWGREINLDNYEEPNKYQTDVIFSPDFMLGAGGELKINLAHKMKDTFSIRLGGAYNFRLGEQSRFITRLGVFYDSAATNPQNTRLDFNTFDKIALTVGGGYKWRGLTVNVAYAFVYSPSRTVTNSETTAVDSNFGTEYPANYTTTVVGNGTYVPSNHTVSVGLSFNFSEFKRPTLFKN